MTPMDWIGEVKSPAAGRQFGRSFNLLVKKCQGLKTTTQLIIPYTMIRIGVFIYDSEKKKKKKENCMKFLRPIYPSVFLFDKIKYVLYCRAIDPCTNLYTICTHQAKHSNKDP